jgi:hypothetical protein
MNTIAPLAPVSTSSRQRSRSVEIRNPGDACGSAGSTIAGGAYGSAAERAIISRRSRT